MSLKPFVDDPELGIKRYWKDNGDGTASVVTQQDVTDVIEHAKERAKAQNTSRGRFMGDKWGAAAAIIPVGVQLKWLTEEGLDIYNPAHADRLKKKLNDPEWMHLRTNHFRM